MSYDIVLEPLAPWWIIVCATALAALVAITGFMQLARGAWLRAAATLTLITTLLNPIAVQSDHEHIPDVALIVADTSESQSIGQRREQTTQFAQMLQKQLSSDPSLDVRMIQSGAATADGTTLMDAAQLALDDVPPDRVAGIILLSDGQVHDAASAVHLPKAPVHTLLTGARGERDRRLSLISGPRFALVEQSISVSFRVDDLGVGNDALGKANVSLRIDGTEVTRVSARMGQIETVNLKLPHAGENIVEIEAEPGPYELTPLNNRAVLIINGVRDRLRVLLISGLPNPGERTWRNLLKADPAVDLVHFTILRPPEKQDGTPIEEMSLIAFPTSELFEDKITQFDLIILDRFQNENILPAEYLQNIATYVEQGGALLAIVGPDYIGPYSIHDTPLETVLPAAPAGSITESAFRPRVSDAGKRHPVTSGLPGANRENSDATWGRWMRIADAIAVRGDVVMEGPDRKPLLMLARSGKGRVAQLLSDHAWLWARGYDGGGPQAELLRRLAHWLMKEPTLEEERLTAEIAAGMLKVTRRTMKETAPPARMTRPDGTVVEVPLVQIEPGRFEGRIGIDSIGLYRVSEDGLDAIAAAGALNPKEFADVRATKEIMQPVAEASGGGMHWLSDGLPSMRRVREGGRASGAGWIGLIDRQNYATLSVSRTTLLDPVLAVILALGLWLLAWRREGT
jgi:hypothetical protein